MQQLLNPSPTTRTQDQLRSLFGVGERHQTLGRGCRDHVVHAAAQLLDQQPLLRELFVGIAAQPIIGEHVHADQIAPDSAGHTGCPTDQDVAPAPAGDADDDSFAGLPGLADPVYREVGGEGFLDSVGNPQQSQFAQCTKVAGPEVVVQRGVDAFCGIDVSVGHAPPQCFRGHVDQLDLVGATNHGVGNGLALRRSGDLADHIVERFEVLHVDRRDDVDAGVEQELDVLPALLVSRPGRVGVGVLVDQDHARAAAQDGLDIHLLKDSAAIFHCNARHHLEIAELSHCVFSAVGLDDTDHHIGPAFLSALTLAEHRVGLAHSRSSTEVDA